MLEAGSRNGKVQRFLIIITVCKYAVDKPSHEGISASYTVNDMGDIILRCLIKFLAVKKYTRPGVMICI